MMYNAQQPWQPPPSAGTYGGQSGPPRTSGFPPQRPPGQGAPNFRPQPQTGTFDMAGSRPPTQQYPGALGAPTQQQQHQSQQTPQGGWYQQPQQRGQQPGSVQASYYGQGTGAASHMTRQMNQLSVGQQPMSQPGMGLSGASVSSLSQMAPGVSSGPPAGPRLLPQQQNAAGGNLQPSTSQEPLVHLSGHWPSVGGGAVPSGTQSSGMQSSIGVSAGMPQMVSQPQVAGHPSQISSSRPVGPPSGMFQHYSGQPGLGMTSSSGQSMGPPSGPGMGSSLGPGIGPPSGPGMGPPSGPGMGPPSGPGFGPSGPGFGPSGGMGHPGMVGMHCTNQPSGLSGPGMGGPPSPTGQPGYQQSPQPAGPSLENMPSAVAVYKADQENRGSMPYMTNDRGIVPPFITTKFQAIDNGNCNPRYLRSTLYCAPASNDLLNQCKIPFAVIAQPFAIIPENEVPLQLVDHGPGGPIRSRRGRGYINPFVQFTDGGRCFLDRLDGFTNEVPPEYFCHLDHRGMRADLDRRPELQYGSVEFVATSEYCKEGKFPKPPAYLFVVDVGYNSIQSGMLSLWASSILELLDNLPKERGAETSTIRVGFITYGKAIQFFKLKETQTQPQVMVLTDIADVFMPLLEGFVVDLEEARPVIESLMQQLPEMYNQSSGSDGILGPAVKAGMEALKAAGCPGKLFVFHSTFPSSEIPGKLQNREDRKLLLTEKEKTQYAHQTTYYRKLAEECVDAGVSVDLFLFVNQYIDVPTVGTLSSTTGGKIYKYKNFRAAIDGNQFLQDLSKRLSVPMAFDAIMRVRCSPGIRAVDFYGNFFMNNTTDVQLACVDPETSVAVDIKHDDKLDDREGAYIQVALLYTSMTGQRRIRVHNLALQCSSQLSDLYRSVDIHALMTFLSKKALFLMLSTPYKTINERLTEQCAVMLACYRKHCSAQSSAGQLILPECMKLLPLYATCILKNECLRGGGDMPIDDKSWLMQTVQGFDLISILAYFYPRLLPLHTLVPGEDSMPEQLRCSCTFMQSDGVYLLENGMNLFIWVGQAVKPEWLQCVFGVSVFAQLDPEKIVQLLELNNPVSLRVRGVVEQIRAERQCFMRLIVVKQKDKSEGFFRRFLVEDKGIDGSPSYVEYLCHLHRQIKELLS